LPNNATYEGVGYHGSIGFITIFSNLTNSYTGVTISRTLLGNSGVMEAGLDISMPLYTIDFSSCIYLIPMAVAWAGITTAIFGGINPWGIGVVASIASFWPYTKWTPSSMLEQQRTI
jgi:hypothetical protein